MPAPEITPRPANIRPVLGHVNLMADTLIANANLDDLRAIVRSMVASATPGIATALTAAARDRLQQTNARCHPGTYNLFTTYGAHVTPTPQLQDVLKRARALYGSGMGFASLSVLGSAVRSTIGLHWDGEGDVADILAVIDADIAQAIQSCKEEVEAGRVGDYTSARKALADLRSTVDASYADVETWGGEFPFERAASSLAYWSL
ncbi:hypothetical protein DFH08DRAFT_770284 [Mycena albidolilacea]|uniref:Uncharacterized protein n=1 Tax=Mycena albidolilacea TaxID=1033008 RepID=A0AAD7F0S6_9AGAR|nr:hypothetical protein DFH08DRAFT_770284 [Mycena albidolilacea]